MFITIGHSPFTKIGWRTQVRDWSRLLCGRTIASPPVFFSSFTCRQIIKLNWKWLRSMVSSPPEKWSFELDNIDLLGCGCWRGGCGPGPQGWTSTPGENMLKLHYSAIDINTLVVSKPVGHLRIDRSRSLPDTLVTMEPIGKRQVFSSGCTIYHGKKDVSFHFVILFPYPREMDEPWVVWIQGKLGPSYLSDIGLDSFALMEAEK